MERDQAQLILDHIDIIKHFAKGGMLEHCGHDWAGRATDPRPVTNGIIINCLPMYRKVNKRIQKPDPQYCSRWCPLKRKDR